MEVNNHFLIHTTFPLSRSAEDESRLLIVSLLSIYVSSSRSIFGPRFSNLRNPNPNPNPSPDFYSCRLNSKKMINDLDEIEDEIESLRIYGRTYGMSNDVIEEMVNRAFSSELLPDTDCGRRHIRAMPMFELLSVSVKPDNTLADVGVRPWEIHGFIKVTATDEQDGDDDVDLYYQPLDDPEIISGIDSDGNLELTLPDLGPLYSIFPAMKLVVDLKDLIRKQDLINKSFLLDYKDYQDFDEVKSLYVVGDHATVCVQYIIYRAAVVADVELILSKKCVPSEAKVEVDNYGKTGDPSELKFEKDSDKSDRADVSGTVYASFCKDSCNFVRGFSPVALFMSPTGSIQVELGTPMKLWRSVIAVPAYSSLVLKTALTVDGCWAISDIAEFAADDCTTSVKNVEGPNGLLCQVRVKWSHTYLDTIESIEKAPGQEREASKTGQNKRSRLFDRQQASPPSCCCLYSEPLDLEFTSETLMELFSVFIGLNKDEVSTIYGTIVVADCLDESIIFEKKESSLEYFAANKTLSLEGPQRHCFSSVIGIEVDLKADGVELCKGYLGWDEGSNLQPPWLNRRICSIIAGKCGYVALHYTIFSAAVQARVKVFFSSITNFTNVSGTIVSKYSDHEYRTCYEREYYQSVLFSRPQESPCQLFESQVEEVPKSIANYVDSGERVIPISLAKSVVCVPKDSSLTLDVNLSTEIGSADFEATMEFMIGRDVCYRIKSQNYRIYMLVEWSGVCLPAGPKIKMYF